MEFEIYRENDARFHWRLIGDDGTRLAVSAVTFGSAARPSRGRSRPMRARRSTTAPSLFAAG